MAEKMTIRDFIKMDIDIDVCDDYDESCYIAFCGDLRLTPKGQEHFADVLDREVEVMDDIAILPAESDEDVAALREFFFSAAGFCSEKRYHELFED